MGSIKKVKMNDDPRVGDKELTPRDAMIIEQTLDSFGITVRVAEINFRPKDTEFCLDVAMGTPLENITKLHKDIAMALASMTGDVEIEAPVPGKSVVAIRMPFEKQWYETRLKGFKAKQKYQKNNLIKPESKQEDIKLTWRGFIVGLLYLISNGILKLANLIKGDKNADI